MTAQGQGDCPVPVEGADPTIKVNKVSFPGFGPQRGSQDKKDEKADESAGEAVVEFDTSEWILEDWLKDLSALPIEQAASKAATYEVVITDGTTQTRTQHPVRDQDGHGADQSRWACIRCEA